MFFFVFKPEERARRYIERAFEEYKAAIRKNPGNKELFDEYAGILRVRRGEINSMVELALLFREMGMEKESDSLLLEIILKDKKGAVAYLESRISETMSPEKRINLYLTLLKLVPDKGEYWYVLGKLYLGMSKQKEGTEALEQAYSYNIKSEDMFYYLGMSLIQQGDFKKAEFYINEGLKIKDSVELHKLRYTLYSRQKKQQFARREKEKIGRLLANKKIIEKPAVLKPEAPPGKPSYAKPIIMPGFNPYRLLYVDKKKQELLLCSIDDKGINVLQKFPVTTGKNFGQKENKGDEKTPHGAYLLTSKIDGSGLPPKYGVAAYPLNYPNHIDRRLKRDGNGIWLHGTPIERPPYHSEGCVVLSDKDMNVLMEHITTGKTFIIIEKDISKLKAQMFNEVMASLGAWEKGWESLDIDKYMDAYDESFYSGGRNKKEYRAYKERVNRNKNFINVELSDVQIMPYGDTPFGEMALAFFRQRYKANDFSSSSRKMLYLVKRGSGWKVIAEEVI